jgi:hypothetical protein
VAEESSIDTSLPWPHWMLRYVGSDDEGALEDLTWSVGGSPPYGGVSYEEAAAVYELLESYHGPGSADEAAYGKVASFIKGVPERVVALEIFRCMDAIQSAAEDYGRTPVDRGIALSRQVNHRGSEAAFLSFEAGWHHRQGDLTQAKNRALEALDIFLELADADPVYARRAEHNAQNAISFAAMSGDITGARNLLQRLAEVIQPEAAEQIRRALAGA